MGTTEYLQAFKEAGPGDHERNDADGYRLERFRRRDVVDKLELSETPSSGREMSGI